MQRLPGLLSGLALILFIVKPGYPHEWDTTSNRAFLDPIDYSLGKKSCRDGYVHGIDHFIVTGFINVTGFTPRQIPGVIVTWYLYSNRYFLSWFPQVKYDMSDEACTDVTKVPLDKCRCRFESAIIVRVKCSITADIQHGNKPFRLSFRTKNDSYSIGGTFVSSYKNMSKVYGDSSCTTIFKLGASRNGGTSPYGGNNGMPGLICLVTALVCTVTSMLSNGQ